MPTRVGTVKVRSVPFQGARELVTLDDPAEGPGRAKEAFARLRPPTDHPEHETAAWRAVVAGVAVAVRVLPAPRTADVTALSTRPGEAGDKSFAEEARDLAAEHPDPELPALVDRILAQVGA